MVEICNKEDCTGCSACFNVCAHGAISMEEDERGFLRPHISQDKCVDCGLCAKICPVNYPVELNAPQKRYVGYASDVKEQFPSTSGGIATAVCRYVIRKGGVAYGSSAMDYHDIHHIRIDKEEDLEKIRGSKYVQSRMGDIYRQVKDDLKTREVAFVGTPCQVAGLKCYLRKPYDNLITMDFVCHGVPNNRVLNSAVESYEVTNVAKSVGFRRKKESGDTVYGLFVRDKEGRLIVNKSFPDDPYITGFLSAMYYRPSCYTCHYAQIHRSSDLTLGDYKEREMKTGLPEQKHYGLSLILANTEKGRAFLEEVKNYVEKEELEDPILASGQLKRPMPKHKNSDDFWQEYLSKGFEEAATTCIMPEMKKVRRSIMVGHIRDFLYRIPLMEKLYRKIKTNNNE